VLRSGFALALGLACAVSCTGAGDAADLAPAPFMPSGLGIPPLWIVTLSANTVFSPQYSGAKNYSVSPFPSISVRRVGEPETFGTPEDGTGFNFSEAAWIRFGPVFRYQGGRYLSGNPQLYGLAKVPWTIQGGGFVEIWPNGHFRMRAELVHGFRWGRDGLVGYLSADWVEHLGPWTLSAGPRVTLINTKEMRTRFAISPEEALANGTVLPYQPRGGLSGAGVAAAAIYRWSPQWATALTFAYQRLVGDAGKSPIVSKLGSRDQFTVGVRLSYSFLSGE